MRRLKRDGELSGKTPHPALEWPKAAAAGTLPLGAAFCDFDRAPCFLSISPEKRSRVPCSLKFSRHTA
jgi:hypothetical protein